MTPLLKALLDTPLFSLYGSKTGTTIDRLEKAYGEILKAFLRSYSFRDFLLHSDLSTEFILSADEGLEVTVWNRKFYQ